MPNALDLLTKTEDNKYVPRLDKGMRFLFVGRSGSGKSSAGASFPKPMHYIDCDYRIKGITSTIDWLGMEQFEKIGYDQYNPSDGYRAIANKLNEFGELINKKNPKAPATIEVDSLVTLIYTLALDSQKLRGAAKGDTKGRVRGDLNFLHPDDYNYIITGIRNLIFNYVFPCAEEGVNFIFTAWITDKWGKNKSAKDFDPPEVIGERIIGPQNTVEELVGLFDEVYYFRKKAGLVSSVPPQYTVEFNGSFAKTALGLPPGEFDITGKNFYEVWSKMVKEKQTYVK